MPRPLDEAMWMQARDRRPRRGLARLVASCLALVALPAVAPEGCGGPDIRDGALACGVGEPRCPPDFACGPDGRCHVPGPEGGDSDAGDAPRCGDGVCGKFETCERCVDDCGECDASCNNNGVPDPGESCSSCPQDDTCCGNGKCEPMHGETCSKDCNGDCASLCLSVPDCGDGVCEGDENCLNCPSDCGESGTCGSACGNGQCEEMSWHACPADCPR